MVSTIVEGLKTHCMQVKTAERHKTMPTSSPIVTDNRKTLPWYAENQSRKVGKSGRQLFFLLSLAGGSIDKLDYISCTSKLLIKVLITFCLR